MDRRDFLKRGCAVVAATSFVGLGNVSFANGKESTPNDNVETIPFQDSDLDAKLSKPITVAVIGYGARGSEYARYALEYGSSVKIVSVADIAEFRAKTAQDLHKIEKKRVYGDWKEFFKHDKFCDAVVIALPDALHYESCLAALDKGYHVLLEKPIAPTAEECQGILDKAHKTGLIVGVCHVLRYAPYFTALKKVLDSGEIGDLISIQHFEAVEAIHMSHSFVRGNWSNSKVASPMIISKSCHDLDILRWLVGKKCEKVSAFGNLSHFRKENAPEGATKRCLDGCPAEKDCTFSAKNIYLEKGERTYVFDNLSDDPQKRREQLVKYLNETPYGKCVYYSDNDQCDTYTMTMKFEGGINVGFQMEGLTSYGARCSRIQGTKGDIVGDMSNFVVTNFKTGKQRKMEAEVDGGHGGGDWRLMRDFVRAVGNNDASLLTSNIDASVESHLMGFAAERSRKEGTIITL